jgi:hypothetical protein
MQDQQPAAPIERPVAPADSEPTEPPVAPPALAAPVSVPVSASPVAPRAGKPRGGRLLNVALAGAFVLAIAGVAFAVGRFTAPAAVSAGSFPNGGQGGQFFQGRNGQGGQNGGLDGRGAFFSGGGPTIEGTVESVTDTTLTLKTASGQTIQIALDGSTTYHAQTDASASDVKTGGKVLVRLALRGAGAAPGSSPGTAAGGPTSPSASDVTVVP